MAENDVKSENITSANITSVAGPAGLFTPGDPTAQSVDVTDPDKRTPGSSGISKTAAHNKGNPGHQGGGR